MKNLSYRGRGLRRKTTLLYTLAREARERGLSCLLLPTTHMQLPERDGVLTGRAEDVIEKLKKTALQSRAYLSAPQKSKK